MMTIANDGLDMRNSIFQTIDFYCDMKQHSSYIKDLREGPGHNIEAAVCSWDMGERHLEHLHPACAKCKADAILDGWEHGAMEY